MLLVLAAPNTEKYYSEKIGFETVNNAYIIKRGEKHTWVVNKI